MIWIILACVVWAAGVEYRLWVQIRMFRTQLKTNQWYHDRLMALERRWPS